MFPKFGHTIGIAWPLEQKSKPVCFIRTEHHLVLVCYSTSLGHLRKALHGVKSELVSNAIEENRHANSFSVVIIS